MSTQYQQPVPEWGHSRCPDHCSLFGSQWTVESQPVEDWGQQTFTKTHHFGIRKQNQKNLHRLHRHLSRLLSHSSCASRRILSSSPCRVEEMLSSGPVRLSLRLTAAISSSSSTQEPDGGEEKTEKKNNTNRGVCYEAAPVGEAEGKPSGVPFTYTRL